MPILWCSGSVFAFSSVFVFTMWCQAAAQMDKVASVKLSPQNMTPVEHTWSFYNLLEVTVESKTSQIKLYLMLIRGLTQK